MRLRKSFQWRSPHHALKSVVITAARKIIILIADLKKRKKSDIWSVNSAISWNSDTMQSVVKVGTCEPVI